MQKILCVEDAADIAFLLAKLFKTYDVRVAHSLSEARKFLATESFSLILLDIQLPDGSGFDLSAELQDSGKNIPLIFLSAQSDFASKASAFSLGADDYIEKPFDPKELKLRVDAKLRKVQANQASDDSLVIGDVRCVLSEQRIYQQGQTQPIDLTTLEFRLFTLLAKTPQKIFSRSEILERVWGDSISVTERAVDVHVSHLRKKLEATQVTVESVVGSGYRILVRKL